MDNPNFRDSLLKQDLITRAHLEFAAGEKFSKLAFQQGSLNVDLFTDAIDSFNRVGNLSDSVDFELEAISEAALGNIFYLGLKNNTRAR